MGVTALNVLDSKRSFAAAQMPDWPRPYAPLDVEQVRKVAHDAFWSGNGCSYGPFYGVAKSPETVVGDPYTTFPSEIMIYGHGGGAGWGATCGAINGAAALISLVRPKDVSDKLVSELYGWYTQVELPTATSNQYGVDNAFGVNKGPGKRSHKTKATPCTTPKPRQTPGLFTCSTGPICLIPCVVPILQRQFPHQSSLS